MKAAARLARLRGRLPEILREVQAQMVRVEGGRIAMGCTPEQESCDNDENPVRAVQVESFEIGQVRDDAGALGSGHGREPQRVRGLPDVSGRDGQLGRCPGVSAQAERGRGGLSAAERGGVGVRGPRRAAERAIPVLGKRRLGEGRVVLRKQRQPDAPRGAQAGERAGPVRHVGERPRNGCRTAGTGATTAHRTTGVPGRKEIAAVA